VQQHDLDGYEIQPSLCAQKRSSGETSRGQGRSAASLAQRVRVAESWNAILALGGQTRHEGDCTSPAEGRSQNTASVEFEVRLGRAKEVPVRHQLRTIGPGGRSARGAPYVAAALTTQSTTLAALANGLISAALARLIYVSFWPLCEAPHSGHYA
jgi:hypothetical protein